jgi:FAD/FMN-containing dehydrogenase
MTTTPPMNGTDQAETLAALRAIVPTEQIETQYDVDQGPGGAWAVEPASEVELVELLKWANARHAAVYTRRPRRTDTAASGIRPRIYLRARRMNRIIDTDIVSGTVTVQTGITMAELHRELEERGFSTGFPTRPWRQEPLGAVVSAALDAHWGPRYGSMEDQVLALGVILPDGTVAHSRATPRRATGPDFDRIFLGSRGRFGIIFQVTLRIYPQASRTVKCYAAPSLSAALAAARRVFELGVDLRAVEILTPAPDRNWGRRRAGLTDALPVMLLIEPQGLVGGHGPELMHDTVSRILTPLDPPGGWNVHEGLLPPPRAWTAPVVPVKWSDLQQLALELGADVPPGLWVVRMSRHGGHLSLADGVDAASAERVRALIAARQEDLGTALGTWRALESDFKRRLDPKGILNPGGA